MLTCVCTAGPARQISRATITWGTCTCANAGCCAPNTHRTTGALLANDCTGDDWYGGTLGLEDSNKIGAVMAYGRHIDFIGALYP